jgi:plasmid maintenance system antidote protein VapI
VKEVHENTKDIETMKRRDARTAGIALGVSAVFGTAVSFLMNILQK